MEHEQLFTDLTSIQAETVAAGDSFSEVRTSYGEASSRITPNGRGSFHANLFVKDLAKDGYPVYVKFQGAGANNRILTGSTQYPDLNGADGYGTYYEGFNASFGENVVLKKVRVVIYRKWLRSVAGDWVYF